MNRILVSVVLDESVWDPAIRIVYWLPWEKNPQKSKYSYHRWSWWCRTWWRLFALFRRQCRTGRLWSSWRSSRPAGADGGLSGWCRCMEYGKGIASEIIFAGLKSKKRLLETMCLFVVLYLILHPVWQSALRIYRRMGQYALLSLGMDRNYQRHP